MATSSNQAAEGAFYRVSLARIITEGKDMTYQSLIGNVRDVMAIVESAEWEITEEVLYPSVEPIHAKDAAVVIEEE